MSHISLMNNLGKQLRRYVMINLISRDLIANSFQGMIRRCQKRVELKGVLSQMNSMCDFGAPLTIGPGGGGNLDQRMTGACRPNCSVIPTLIN